MATCLRKLKKQVEVNREGDKMKITYEAEVDKDIVDGIGSVRKLFNNMLEELDIEVLDSKIETDYEVDRKSVV